MKQKALLFIAFALVFVQGWALPIDSLNMKTGNITSKVQGLVNLKDSLPFVGSGIRVNPSSLDFGSVTIGETVTKSFTVMGTRLKVPLTLELHLTRSVSGTEKFTLSRTSISATQALRGVTVSVTYAPNELGADGGIIYIKGAGLETKTVQLSGTGLAAPSPSITVTPSTVLIPSGESSGKFIVTGSNLTGPLTIKSNSSLFTVNKTTIKAAQAKAGVTVMVTYKPTTVGDHSGIITVSGGGAESQRVNVVKMSDAPSVTIYPSASTVDFGTVAKGNYASKSFSVTGTNLTAPLTMTLVDETNSFTINRTSITPDEAANGATFSILYMPKSAGTHAAKLIINYGSSLFKEITLTGECVVPTITVTPSSGDFGTVVLGESKSITFRIKGTNVMLPLTVKLTDSTRMFTSDATTISPSQATSGMTFKVTYKPTRVGTHTATLTISGGGAASKTITLRGRCVDGSGMMALVEQEEENGDNNDLETCEATTGIGNAVISAVDELVADVKIYAEGQSIIIESAVAQNAVISDISGHARSFSLQAGRNEIPVNGSGIYIVRMREKTAKLMLK